ncbi:hypothetical protein HZH68_004723 [Vespula germanica]|uniref:Uncharacterized protein n=1 Tax=Vespula germanica TaxID=30212 RepID=A0A834NI74_VESGE|nr:hypothetical protein HZH68_004723 [Vespula germanica]
MHSVRRRNSCSIESKATIKSNVSSGRATGDGDLCLPRSCDVRVSVYLEVRSKASLQATPSIRKLGGKFAQSIAAVETRYSPATYKVRRSKPETVTRLKPSRFRGKPRSAEISTPSFAQTSNGSCKLCNESEIKRDPALEVSIMETFLITLRHVTRPRNLRYASQVGLLYEHRIQLT